MPPASTPCVHVCILDPETGLCLGCGRRLAEIVRWSAMTETERTRIMAELSDRMAGRSREQAERP